MKKKPERWIALSVILCATSLMIALGLILGRITLPSSQRHLIVDFVTVTGISLNSPVKYAGAQVGRVSKIRVLSRKEEIKSEKETYSIQVDLELDSSLELGEDVEVAIKQDGLLGSRFIALVPGSPESPDLDSKKVLLGENPVELDDLLPMAETLIGGLQPVIQHLNSISAKVDEQLPELLSQVHQLLDNSSGLIGAVNTKESKAQLAKTLSNLAVITDNLKVVSTQAKGITSTLGQKPWSLIWGGAPNKLPTEEEILKSNKALPVPCTPSSVVK